MAPRSCESPTTLSVDDPVFGATALQQVLASCTGAVLTSLTMTPFDVVKIRLQAQQRQALRQHSFLYCNGLMDHLCVCPNETSCHGAANGHGCHSASPPRSASASASSSFHSSSTPVSWYRRPCPTPYTGPLDAAVRIARAEGLTSLWSGLLPTLVLAVPATLLYFTCYDQLRVRLQRASWPRDERRRDVVAPMLAGTVARVCACSVVAPLELVRTRMQAGRWTYSKLATAMSSEIAAGRVSTLWRGLTPTLIRDVPFSAVYWCGYEWLKRRLLLRQDVAPSTSSSPTTTTTSRSVLSSAGVSLLAGAGAGSAAAVITLPFDVVKTHWQLEFGRSVALAAPSSHQSVAASVLATLRDIYKRQGVGGLFVGLTPRLVKVAPACAIMVTSYEVGKTFFLRYNLRHHSCS